MKDKLESARRCIFASLENLGVQQKGKAQNHVTRNAGMAIIGASFPLALPSKKRVATSRSETAVCGACGQCASCGPVYSAFERACCTIAAKIFRVSAEQLT